MLQVTRLPKLELCLTGLCFLLILGIPQYGVIGAFVLVFAYLRRSPRRAELLHAMGLQKPASWLPVVALAALLGGATELFMEIVFNPLAERLTHLPIDLEEISFGGSILGYLGWVVIGFVLGGLLEEILFRGFLLTRVARLFASAHTGRLVALLLTSTAFGLCHAYQGLSGVLSTATIGLLLGLLFQRRNNLWYPILTHGFINLTGFTVLYLHQYETLRTLLC